MKDYQVTPNEAGKALLSALSLAEHFKRWGLMRELLQYMTEADAQLHYFGPGQYLISYPSDPLKGSQ